MDSFYSLIPSLKEINFADSKNLLQKLSETAKKGECGAFWELCSILKIFSDSEEKNEKFSKWLSLYVSMLLPNKIDPYIKALFTNNADEVQKYSEKISPLTKLIFPSRKNHEYIGDTAPEFFSNKKFVYGKEEITGKDIWLLITCSFDQFAKYKIPLIVIFALFHWYSGCTSIKTSIQGFFSLNIKPSYDDESSHKILNFLRYYEEEKRGDLMSVAKCLPAIDAFFFIEVFSVLDSKSISKDVLNSSANNAAHVLIKKGHWEHAVAVYNTVDQNEKANLVIEQNASTSLEMTSNEVHLIEILKIPEDAILKAKAKKAIYFAQFATDTERLNKIAEAIDLSFGAKDFEQIHYLLFDEYIPLMSDLGEDMLRAIQYVDMIDTKEMTPDIKDDFIVLKVVSLAINGSVIPDDMASVAAQKLKEGWGTFAFRRDVSSLLLQQGVNIDYLKDIDAIPKDELKSRLEKN